MSMRVNTIVTHLRPEDAYTLIEFPDQVRDVLMQSYGDGMKTMLNTDGVKFRWGHVYIHSIVLRL